MSSNPSTRGPLSGPFPIVVFDFDHTLFDFEGSKQIAFAEVVEAAGTTIRQEHFDTFTGVEKPLWGELERGERGLDSLNNARFEGLVAKSDIDADPAQMAEQYLIELGRSGGLLPGARALLDALRGTCHIAMASNGYAEVQESRMDNFDLRKYFDTVVVSSTVGHAKPDARFFDFLFDLLAEGDERPDPSTTLMVGDSLTSDMAGGLAYGMATCWYNPSGKTQPETHPVDWVVANLAPIEHIVHGRLPN